MATEPQPTSQGILQASRCLERGGTVAKGPWDLPFQEIPQAPEPSNPNKVLHSRQTSITENLPTLRVSATEET